MNTTEILTRVLVENFYRPDIELAKMFSESFKEKEFNEILNDLILVTAVKAEVDNCNPLASLVLVGFLLGAKYTEVATVENLLSKETSYSE